VNSYSRCTFEHWLWPVFHTASKLLNAVSVYKAFIVGKLAWELTAFAGG
jgi:hypothetical protein